MEKILTKALDEVLTPRYSDELRDYIIQKAREPFKNPATGEYLSLKDYELPKSVSFVSELPRNQNSGKIDYRSLEELAAKEA